MSKSDMILYPKTIIPKPILNEIIYPVIDEEIKLCKSNCLILIAPSGYGKTTILAQYARNTNRKVVWLTFRDDDREKLNLIKSIQQACKIHIDIEIKIKEMSSLEDFLHQLIDEIVYLDLEVDFILDHVEKISQVHGKFLS